MIKELKYKNQAFNNFYISVMKVIKSFDYTLKLLILVLVLCVPFESRSSIVETFNLYFDENDFVFNENVNGEIEIESKFGSIYSELNEPGIPIMTKDVVVEANCEFESVTLNFIQKKFMSDVVIASSPKLYATDDVTDNDSAESCSYDNNLRYPVSNCQYVNSSLFGNMKVLHFLTTPFIYDAKEKSLYFIDHMEVHVELSNNTDIALRPSDKLSSSIVKSFVLNPDRVDDLYSKQPMESSIDSDERIEYLIVTSKELESSFKPLKIWKNEKGLYAKILTIEEIVRNYSGKDTQHKIKNCLFDLYKNHGLKYVLLGGDDMVVPVRGCCVSTSEANILSMPADIYYSCFNGNFEWNENGNDLYGEIDDNINLTQSIYVTRVPLDNAIDVDSFTKKLMMYEKEPIYNNNILMCGANTFNSGTPDHSDAELQGDALYKKYINPYWNGTRYKFYDTFTDFDGGPNYELSPRNLKSQLGEGYSFMDIITHGSTTSWKLESGGNYDVSYGRSQNNKGFTLITTTSCHTNAFDIYDPSSAGVCLSESLIRNPNSGIVAYWGCSRQGWGYEGSNLGPSSMYNADFYKLLFSKKINNNSFGVVAAAVKATNIARCQRNGPFRWLQYGINPIGDPEMPIWIEHPKTLESLGVSLRNSCVRITTNNDSCKICLVDEWDKGDGYYKVYEDVSDIEIYDVPEEASACVTKLGYLPKQFSIQLVQNKEYNKNITISKDIIIMGSSITSQLRTGNVDISGGQTSLYADVVVLGPGTSVGRGASLKIKKKSLSPIEE